MFESHPYLLYLVQSGCALKSEAMDNEAWGIFWSCVCIKRKEEETGCRKRRKREGKRERENLKEEIMVSSEEHNYFQSNSILLLGSRPKGGLNVFPALESHKKSLYFKFFCKGYVPYSRQFLKIKNGE